ncbi:MAG: hypothetical protein JSW01_03915 [Candidatus Bathyarchaeota archaeon]|nr:MAG: hypothetical protein JSW01_03915 [Candidatus Bathyarchaeota archaeon]
MSSPIEPLMPYLNTFVFFAAYSVLYKDNPMYRFVQSLVVGIGAGFLFMAQIDQIVRILVPSLPQPHAVIALVMGVAFFCIFIPGLINIYRAASILVMTVGIGIVLPYGVAITWTATLGYSQRLFTGLGPFVAGICYALGMSYFLFTGRLEKPTAPLRTLGRVVLLVYTAMCISMTALGKLNLIQWKVLDALWGIPSTWFIPVGIFVLILIDAFVYPFLGVKKAKEVESEA